MPINKAVEALKQGGIIAYPTEAVFGFGCDPMNQSAVMRLLTLKQRPVEKGLIVIASHIEQLKPFIDLMHIPQFQTVMSSWPGPSTWTIPCKTETPPWLTGKHNKLAVRVTAHPVAAELCELFGAAIVSTSANQAGQPPAKTYAEVLGLFKNELDFILNDVIGDEKQVTTIRDAISGKQLR